MARKFDGVDDTVILTNPSVMNLASGDSVMLEVWARYPSLPSAVFTQFGRKGTAPVAGVGWALRNNAGNFWVFVISDGTTQLNPQQASAFSANTWYHLAGVYNRDDDIARI